MLEQKINSFISQRTGRLLLWLLLLLVSLYYFCTISQVPFHPDESTNIFKSSDFNVYFTQIRSLFWQSNQEGNLRQYYREVDAPLSSLIIGAGFDIFGQNARLNDWNWSETWAQNVQNGALPNLTQLTLARLSVSFLFPFSLILIYNIGKKIRGPLFGLLLGLLYSSNALILLHTRRSMGESALAFFICLVIWGLLNTDKKPWIVMLGVTLAFNSKQSAIALLPVALLALCWNPTHYLSLRRMAMRCLAFFCIFLSLTFLLNPFLWSNPVDAVKAAVQARKNFTQSQITTVEAISPSQVYSPGERVLAMLAQYYILPTAAQDVGNYSIELASSINNYLKFPGTDLFRGFFWGGLMILLTLFGFCSQIIKLFHQGISKSRTEILLLLSFLFLFAALILMLPIPYQRYWIPLTLLISICILQGIYELTHFFSLLLGKITTIGAHHIQ